MNQLTISTESLTLLEAASKIGSFAKDYDKNMGNLKMATSNSWIELSSVTDIEPLTLIDASIQHNKVMPSLMSACLKVFTSYYLRAASLMTNLDNFELIERLDKLNPNRRMKDSFMAMGRPIAKKLSTLSIESDTYHSGPMQPYQKYNNASLSMALSTENDSRYSTQEDLKNLNKAKDLFVGHHAKVTFQDKGGSFPIDVNFRLVPYIEPSNVIVSTFGIGSARNSSSERWHRMRAGELSLIDWATLRDIYKKHRKSLISSTSNWYSDTIARRNRQEATKMMKSGMATAEVSALVIISSQTADLIEREVGGRIENFKTRENLLEKTSTMMLVVVDEIAERIKLYRYSVEQVIDLDFSNIEDYNSKGPDVMELINSMSKLRR